MMTTLDLLLGQKVVWYLKINEFQLQHQQNIRKYIKTLKDAEKAFAKISTVIHKKTNTKGNFLILIGV